eukprot:TRINITY_DN1495_c0_g1_i1.p1 TRINITY_DN1495_c0_g1~~TRINITY_DN1495_c0_g1_i1.p1  ORF type:complete len:456 (+),score=100.09 TRINITY_DN1495_c0_g1_i1:55-1422(+)
MSVAANRVGHFYAPGYSDLLKTGAFSDVLVTSPNGKEYKLHRNILATKSSFFSKALYEASGVDSFQEATERKVNLAGAIDDPMNLFEKLLIFFYELRVDISREECLAFWRLALFLQIPQLEEYCHAYFGELFNLGNAHEFLIEAQDYMIPGAMKLCEDVLAAQFDLCFDRDYSGLSHENFLRFLSRGDLKVSREEHVLHFVLKYVRECNLSDAEALPLVQQIRLPFLCADTLATIVFEWKAIPLELKAAAMAEHMKLYSNGPIKDGKEEWILPRETWSSDNGLEGMFVSTADFMDFFEIEKNLFSSERIVLKPTHWTSSSSKDISIHVYVSRHTDGYYNAFVSDEYGDRRSVNISGALGSCQGTGESIIGPFDLGEMESLTLGPVTKSGAAYRHTHVERAPIIFTCKSVSFRSSAMKYDKSHLQDLWLGKETKPSPPETVDIFDRMPFEMEDLPF